MARTCALVSLYHNALWRGATRSVHGGGGGGRGRGRGGGGLSDNAPRAAVAVAAATEGRSLRLRGREESRLVGRWSVGAPEPL